MRSNFRCIVEVLHVGIIFIFIFLDSAQERRDSILKNAARVLETSMSFGIIASNLLQICFVVAACK